LDRDKLTFSTFMTTVLKKHNLQVKKKPPPCFQYEVDGQRLMVDNEEAFQEFLEEAGMVLEFHPNCKTREMSSSSSSGTSGRSEWMGR
jgi:hypothetical protein